VTAATRSSRAQSVLARRAATWAAHGRAQLKSVLTPGLALSHDVGFAPRVRVRLGAGARLTIGAGSYIDEGCVLAVADGGVITIGPGCFLGHHCTISAVDRIEVGRGTFLAEMVSVRDHDHIVGAPPGTGGLVSTPVRLEDEVWLASKVTVLRGTVVGAGTTVAAHAVVRGDIPPRVLAAGIPATVRRRFDERA